MSTNDHLPRFHINKDGALVVTPPKDMDFAKFFADYGFGPENVSDAYRASVALLEKYAPGIAELMMFGVADEEEEKRMKDFVRDFMMKDDAVMAAANLIQQSLETAKVNFLSGIRLGIAMRDGVLDAVDFNKIEVYDSGEDGIDTTPAKVKGAH